MKTGKKKEIWGLYEKAFELAIEEVEKEARKILRSHPKYNEFAMAMGSAFFTYKNGETIAIYRSTWSGNGYRYSPMFKYFQPLIEVFDEFGFMKLTGEAMRFTANGKKVTDW